MASWWCVWREEQPFDEDEYWNVGGPRPNPDPQIREEPLVDGRK
jgi:hypothetical protein